MAWCVRKNTFMKLAEALDDGLRRAFLAERIGLDDHVRMASAVVSDGQGMTPVTVREMEVAYGRGGGEEEEGSGVSGNASSSSSSSSASLETQTCRDCFELMTPPLAPETDLLMTDVAVAGTAAAAGILWLAVLEGYTLKRII